MKYKLIFSVKNNKGLSIVEVVVSAGAFAVFAMLIQSVLLLAHSFQVSQKNTLDMFQINHMIKQKVCMNNVHFKYESINWGKSYSKTIKTEEATAEEEEEAPPVNPRFWRGYRRLTNDSHTTNNPLITLEGEKCSGNDKTECQKVLQDSHTLVVLKSDSQTLSQERETEKSAHFSSGYIFASRCVDVEDNALKKSSQSGHKATFDLDNIESSAKTILEKEKRPYYFPVSTSGQESVFCCENPTNTEDCKKEDKSAIRKYTPRIYVIHLTKSEEPILSSSGPVFAGRVTAVQELPEWQDMDTVWGAGFMLSMSQKHRFSGVAFNLDIITLKNTCATSLGHIKNCATLSPSSNPYSQKLIGLGGSNMTMGQFIIPAVSSCSGYSYSVDTGSTIMF